MSDAPRIADDPSLLGRARDGDVAAFEELVERHRGRVYALALRMLQNPADAAEVAQETFLSAYQHLADFRGHAQFTTWLHRIAMNFCLMRLRHRKVAEEAEREIAGPTLDERGHRVVTGYGTDWARRPDERLMDADLRRVIEAAVAKLPPDHRAVFLLKDIEGLTYEDIGLAVGASVPAVKSRLHRARLALRQVIEGHFSGSGR